MPKDLVAFYNVDTALMNKGRVTDLIYLELYKAFDIAQHSILGETWILWVYSLVDKELAGWSPKELQLAAPCPSGDQ